MSYFVLVTGFYSLFKTSLLKVQKISIPFKCFNVKKSSNLFFSVFINMKIHEQGQYERGQDLGPFYKHN